MLIDSSRKASSEIQGLLVSIFVTMIYNAVAANKKTLCRSLIAGVHFITECVSTLDLHNGQNTSGASMGNRSHSVPGLDIQVSTLMKEIRYFNMLFCHESVLFHV